MQQNTTGLAIANIPDDEKSEDCLYLNVYVPGMSDFENLIQSKNNIDTHFFAKIKADGAAKKSVVVMIHGGAFVAGNARDTLYGPDFLLSQDNVVVTVQYRLGIFGFLNLGFSPYTGNMGLKDQQMALKWIHTNIKHFCGRNDQVLLMGQSAGKILAYEQYQLQSNNS